MNILILGNHCDPGGVTRYMINLASGLTSRGNRVIVASDRGAWRTLFEDKGIRHAEIPIRTKSIVSPKIFFSLWRLRELLGSEKIDIVHANTRVTQCLAYYIWFFFRIPYVSAFHGYYRSSLMRRMMNFSGMKAIAVSNAVKRHMIDDLNIPEASVSVVYNGISLADFLEKHRDKKEFNFSSGDIVMGVLGRISQEKGHFCALQAFKRVYARNKNIFLVFSGQGKLEAKLRESIVRENLTERVRFINAEAADFLDIIDLLLVPSRQEGFGYAVIEAFAKGVPVIGYNVGGIAEIIRHRDNGLLFYRYSPEALAEAIETLLADGHLRSAICRTAADDVQLFSIDAMAANTEEVYKSVLA
ncbi:MAG: glycosyltransferase family 4 protein [Candidatus Omnitrophota bacterium]|nr:glycosyltransferase family 4 protein [Candidatus Omnitrophota bacterium]